MNKIMKTLEANEMEAVVRKNGELVIFTDRPQDGLRIIRPFNYRLKWENEWNGLTVLCFEPIKIKTVEYGGKIYDIAQSDANRMRQLINGVHCWLIEKLVNKKPVVMNVRFTDGQIEAGEGAFIFGCVFLGVEWMPADHGRWPLPKLL